MSQQEEGWGCCERVRGHLDVSGGRLKEFELVAGGADNGRGMIVRVRRMGG